jgi:hypothetical protein
VYTLIHLHAGFHIAVYFATLSYIASTNKYSSKKRWLQAVLVTFLFINAGLNFVGSALGAQWAWIDYRGYPDGPLGFIEEQENIWPTILSDIAGVFVTVVADAILVSTLVVCTGRAGFLTLQLIDTSVLRGLGQQASDNCGSCYSMARRGRCVRSVTCGFRG